MIVSARPRISEVTAVIIGTNRFPAKKPKYDGSSMRKNRLYIDAASIPTRIPPNTPVCRVGIPRTLA
ncbi:hypothetical protein D3C85_1378810 [compost metagenome]